MADNDCTAALKRQMKELNNKRAAKMSYKITAEDMEVFLSTPRIEFELGDNTVKIMDVNQIVIQDMKDGEEITLTQQHLYDIMMQVEKMQIEEGN